MFFFNFSDYPNGINVWVPYFTVIKKVSIINYRFVAHLDEILCLPSIVLQHIFYIIKNKNTAFI